MNSRAAASIADRASGTHTESSGSSAWLGQAERCSGDLSRVAPSPARQARRAVPLAPAARQANRIADETDDVYRSQGSRSVTGLSASDGSAAETGWFSLLDNSSRLAGWCLL